MTAQVPAAPTSVGHFLKDAEAGWDLSVGRAMPRYGLPASPWANPHRIGSGVTPGEALRRSARDLAARPDLLAQLPTLRGRRLACWCHTFDWREGASTSTPGARADVVCHGDVLAGLANRWDGRTPPATWARRALTRWLERTAAPAPSKPAPGPRQEGRRMTR